MIISEKQIGFLMLHMHGYIDTLKDFDARKTLTDSGKNNLDSAIELMNQIYNQQPEELKEIN